MGSAKTVNKPMATFSERLDAGVERETEVLERLLSSGYRACRWGQGVLALPVVQSLKGFEHQPWFRWIPDIIVAGRTTARLIDVKTGRGDTPYYDLEIEAHEAHRAQQYALGFKIVYVWPDSKCSYVDDIFPRRLRTGPQKGDDRTPYWLIPKHIARPWEEVFPRLSAHAYQPRRTRGPFLSRIRAKDRGSL